MLFPHMSFYIANINICGNMMFETFSVYIIRQQEIDTIRSEHRRSTALEPSESYSESKAFAEMNTPECETSCTKSGRTVLDSTPPYRVEFAA